MDKGNNKIILLLGGARSGKSTRAQEIAEELGGRILFCATAEALDDEMQARIEAHKRSRPPSWDTIECSHNVGQALRDRHPDYDTVIIDCITLLVSNCLAMPDQPEQTARDEIIAMVKLMQGRRANFILVSNEVGSGLVPDNKLGRSYRDALGQANQQLAKCADEVYLMAAGLSLRMK
jgi:adenosylcobinamide kinase/adenosylcobinamide-phosphate guanylyltransferase